MCIFMQIYSKAKMCQYSSEFPIKGTLAFIPDKL